MHPFLRDDDLLVVRDTSPKSLRRGNILVYRRGSGGYVVHRLIRKGRGGLLWMKGDGYGLPPEEAGTDAMMGKAVGFVRNGRYVPFGRSEELRSWFLSSLKSFAKRWARRSFRLCGR